VLQRTSWPVRFGEILFGSLMLYSAAALLNAAQIPHVEFNRYTHMYGKWI
jgi:hypothetical protein